MKSASTNPEDLLLWQDFLDGDVQAFERLMSGNFRLLFRYGCKFSRDQEFVKDSIQDLFMALWERRANLNPDAAVKPYLMASLRRLMFRTRLSARSCDEETLQEVEYDFCVEFSVEEQFIAEETTIARTRHIQELIGKLPQRQKEVVYLKFFQELSREQIAKVMAITPQTVSNLLQIAIRQLKQGRKVAYMLVGLLHLLLMR
ncbi:RNA polymerase sigma factor [Dyadobacter sp. CY343]|uniref:RNA polymerase sigma factor n=1 Tax=Dyadobacter sp. CY343 TaxID=2907299 RepID=UPI001F46D07C|nr:sigma-70 family RNA polymerase sigma factor [Dyadobacter sp. CY343]MCE7060285.1 sigma-70 family RNA polymerase sigma factor [Dyadobacter sp. CY343]